MLKSPINFLFRETDFKIVSNKESQSSLFVMLKRGVLSLFRVIGFFFDEVSGLWELPNSIK